jgi:dihydrofolate reductase
MGKIVVTEFISLDGIVEDPGGAEAGAPADWTTFDRGAEGDELKLAELNAADAQLLGRVTYDGFAAAWPAVEDEAGFAAKMNEMPKYVVSKTLHDPAWNNTTVLSGEPVTEITALKRKVAGDILVAGSSELVHLLASNDLVDQYNLARPRYQPRRIATRSGRSGRSARQHPRGRNNERPAPSRRSARCLAGREGSAVRGHCR